MFRTLAVAGTLLAATSPASAQYYGGYPGHRGGVSLSFGFGGFPYGGYPFGGFGGSPYGGFGPGFGFGPPPGFGGYPFGGFGYGGFGDTFGYAVPLYGNRSAYAPPPSYLRPAPAQPRVVVSDAAALPAPRPLPGGPAPGNTGLRVTELLPGPAVEAGLKVGDIITKVAGLPVRTLEETRAALAPIADGNVVVEYLDAATGQPASKVVAVRQSRIGVNVAEIPLN